MQHKNKIMLAAAIGAIAILIVSSVVRCSVSRGAESDADQSSLAEPQQQTSMQGQEASGDSTEASDDALSMLRGHAWQAKDDSSKTVTFKDGMFVEADATGVKVTAFTVTGETGGSDQKTLLIDMIRDGLPSNTSSAVIVEGTEGSLVLTSDAFQMSKTYVQVSTSTKSISLPQLDETYLTLIDHKSSDFSSALETWCRDHVPTATAVTFDGEVYLDTTAKRVAATFHCNDAAKSIITVTYASGTFSVAG